MEGHLYLCTNGIIEHNPSKLKVFYAVSFFFTQTAQLEEINRSCQWKYDYHSGPVRAPVYNRTFVNFVWSQSAWKNVKEVPLD